MIKKVAILILSVFALTACKQSTDVDLDAQIEAIAVALRATTAFSTDRLHYQPGDSVMLRLENTTDHIIGYNLCTATLEVKRDDKWVSQPSLRICTAALFPLQPQESTGEHYPLDASLASGTCRFALKIYSLEIDASEKRANSAIYSNTFNVE